MESVVVHYVSSYCYIFVCGVCIGYNINYRIHRDGYCCCFGISIYISNGVGIRISTIKVRIRRIRNSTISIFCDCSVCRISSCGDLIVSTISSLEGVIIYYISSYCYIFVCCICIGYNISYRINGDSYSCSFGISIYISYSVGIRICTVKVRIRRIRYGTVFIICDCSVCRISSCSDRIVGTISSLEGIIIYYISSYCYIFVCCI